MNNPDTGTEAVKPFAVVLAEHGRPVSQEGRERARLSLASARARRDPQARAALIDSLRRGAA